MSDLTNLLYSHCPGLRVQNAVLCCNALLTSTRYKWSNVQSGQDQGNREEKASNSKYWAETETCAPANVVRRSAPSRKALGESKSEPAESFPGCAPQNPGASRLSCTCTHVVGSECDLEFRPALSTQRLPISTHLTNVRVPVSAFVLLGRSARSLASSRRRLQSSCRPRLGVLGWPSAPCR